jgi:hypothetical protein
LLGRLFESLPLVRHCGADMCILSHIGEPAAPPRVDPARGPPPWDDGRDPLPDWDVMAQPELVYRFDQ